jgi:hypothetical protein
MRKLIAIIFFFCFQLGYSQNLLEHRDTTNLGEGYTYGKRLLLIPFKPYDYKSDADADIAKQNEVEPSLVKLVFRSSIDQVLANSLSNRFEVVRLNLDSPIEIKEDLKAFYNSTGTSYEKPLLARPSQTDIDKENRSKFQVFIDEMAKLANIDRTPKTYKGVDGGEFKAANEATRYYRTTISNPNIVPYMQEKYQNDYFLFINMMEVTTRYDQCIDLENKNYNREFSVHYTLYDRTGKLIVGNVVTLLFPSNTNKINDIIAKNFGVIAKEINKSLP